MTLQKNGRTALIMAGDRRGDDWRSALRSAALYRTFCSLTGFGGTPLRAELAPGAVAGQVRVRFDANVHPGLPWRFEPEQTRSRSSPARRRRSSTARPTFGADHTGQAAYNVSPDQVGKYFKKIQCFCFTEQTLKPGQTVDMPVIFFVDPEIAQGPGHQGHTRDHLELHILSGGNRHRVPLEPRQSKEGSRTTWPRRRTTITIWSTRALAADRRHLRRRAVQRCRHVVARQPLWRPGDARSASRAC